MKLVNKFLFVFMTLFTGCLGYLLGYGLASQSGKTEVSKPFNGRFSEPNAGSSALVQNDKVRTNLPDEKVKVQFLENKVKELERDLIASSRKSDLLQKSFDSISSIVTISPSGKELMVKDGVYIPNDKKFLLNTKEIAGGKISLTGGPSSHITFTNKTNEDLYLFWVDFDGKPTFSRKLKTGDVVEGTTYEKHVHVVTKTNGDVYGNISALAGTDDIDIEK